MESQKLLFIVNPRAGRNKPHGPLFDALSILSQAGYLIRIRQTAAPGDAAEIAAREGPAYDLVVAAGGDGTLNEVISGLMRLESPPPLGYLPQGTTNDFASCLQIPRDPAAAAENIAKGRLRPWTSASGTSAASSMWPPSGPLPAAPTPPPKPRKTPWATLPISWRG